MICLLSNTSRAQSLDRQVLGAAGNYASASWGALSSTAGEGVINTSVTSSLVITQGFQQPLQSDVAVYEEWYQKHTAAELLREAVYGLPELYRDQIRTSRLIANPGCYPTSIILALAPLLKAGVIDPQSIIADSKSGTSGAGRRRIRRRRTHRTGSSTSNTRNRYATRANQR